MVSRILIINFLNVFIDLDECKIVPYFNVTRAGCSQICTNTDGSFQCSCRQGYILSKDHKTCEGKDINKVFFSTLSPEFF